MPITPTLNSFISPAIFKSESVTNPLYAGLLTVGTTYAPPVFNGMNQATTVSPGGLFGWLIYARSQIASPARGVSTASYIEYTSYNSLLNDLNLLGGVTYCLISKSTEGGTHGFFYYNASSSLPNVTGRTAGIDFIHALNYLSYGGVLVISGSCAGLIDYQNSKSRTLDVLIGQTADTNRARFLENNDYIFGIFPSVNDGAGYTMADFSTLFSNAACINFATGATVADRIFNVAGQSQLTLATDSLQTGTQLQYTISSVADVAGAFNRSKNKQDLAYTVAGLDYSTPLNTKITNVIAWTNDTDKNIFKKNRVNFYSQSSSGTDKPVYFLGSDLVGATTGSGSTYTIAERFGPSYISNTIEKNVKNILLKYLFSVNNSSTRSSVTTEVTLYIQSLNEFLDPTYTQILCNSGNNDDNSSVLTVDITVKPLITTESYTFSLTIPTS